MEMKDVSGEKRRAIVSKPCPDKATVQVFDIRSRKKKTVGMVLAVQMVSFWMIFAFPFLVLRGRFFCVLFVLAIYAAIRNEVAFSSCLNRLKSISCTNLHH